MVVKLNQLLQQNSSDHKYLLAMLETMPMESVRVTPIQKTPGKVIVSLQLLEELAGLLQKITQRDQKIKEELDKTDHVFQRIQIQLRFYKSDIHQIKQHIRQNTDKLTDSQMRISKVLNAYRERCREYYLDYLKSLDLEIRRILRPLVPSKVIEEQIKFPHINNETHVSSLSASSVLDLEESLDSQQSVDSKSHPDPNDLTVQKLNDHINMLVSTLETVAKEMIGVIKDSNKRYFEMVNPTQMPSQPPTPIAAPLPEYFIFDEDDSKARVKKQDKVFDESIKWAILERVKSLGEHGVFTRAQIEMLEYNLVEKVKQKAVFDLEALFKGIEISNTHYEQLVFYLINPESVWNKDEVVRLGEKVQMGIGKISQPRSCMSPNMTSESNQSSRRKHRRFQPKLPDFPIDINVSNNEIQSKSFLDRPQSNKQLKSNKLQQQKSTEEFFHKNRRSNPIGKDGKRSPGIPKTRSVARVTSRRNFNEVRVRSITPAKAKENTKLSPYSFRSLSKKPKKVVQFQMQQQEQLHDLVQSV